MTKNYLIASKISAIEQNLHFQCHSINHITQMLWLSFNYYTWLGFNFTRYKRYTNITNP